MFMPRHMLEAQEAADYLKISYWTLLEKARKGLVPHVRIGRRVIFSQEGLDQWMADQEAQSIYKEDRRYGVLRKMRG
jgi:excisionase family DNA binding protein